MHPTDILKHTPKWALYTSGGVIVGVFALKMARNRTSSTSAPADANVTPDATQIGSGPAYGAAGVSPGIIVPPVIVDNPNADQSGTGLGALQDLFMGGAQSLYDAYGNLTSQALGQNQQLVDVQANTLGSVFELLGNSQQSQIAAVASAGAAPQPVAQNPTPVRAYTPPPPPAPVAVPHSAPASKCPGSFPFQSSSGCYKVVCASGKGDHSKGRWHFYSTGKEVKVASTC